MEHNEQEKLSNLNIITTNNRTINISVYGVIPGSSLNISDVNKDISNNYKKPIKQHKKEKKYIYKNNFMLTIYKKLIG